MNNGDGARIKQPMMTKMRRRGCPSVLEVGWRGNYHRKTRELTTLPQSRVVFATKSIKGLPPECFV